MNLESGHGRYSLRLGFSDAASESFEEGVGLTEVVEAGFDVALVEGGGCVGDGFLGLCSLAVDRLDAGRFELLSEGGPFILDVGEEFVGVS